MRHSLAMNIVNVVNVLWSCELLFVYDIKMCKRRFPRDGVGSFLNGRWAMQLVSHPPHPPTTETNMVLVTPLPQTVPFLLCQKQGVFLTTSTHACVHIHANIKAWWRLRVLGGRVFCGLLPL